MYRINTGGNVMMTRSRNLIAGAMILIAGVAQAETNLAITSVSQGVLTWTNVNTNLYYTIEWRPSMTGTNGWTNSYDGLRDITSTGKTITAGVPVFYRVIGSSNRSVYWAPVAKTGRTNEYDPGDDGTYQMGVAWPSPRFVVGTGIASNCVTDNLTGLMWVRNPGTNYMNWSSAILYCEGLDGSSGRGGYTDWRLPNVQELQSLVDYGHGAPALPSDHPFTNILTVGSSDYYWSSTALYDNSKTWRVSLDSGSQGAYSEFNSYLALPVRGGQ